MSTSRRQSATASELERIGVNLLYLVPGEVGGSEIYARCLLGAITALEPQIELVVYAGPEAIESLGSEQWAGSASFFASPSRSRLKPLRAAAELTWLPARLRRDGVQLLHSLGSTSPLICPVPRVVTVLDLIYHHFPDTFPAASRAGLRLLVPAGARRADRVIAISESGKRDLVSTLGLDPGRVDVVHLGFGMSERSDPTPEADLRARYGLGRRPVVLTVSAALRHKNLSRLLDAFAELRREREAVLVVVGHGGLEQQALRDRADALGISDCVLFTGWVSDRDLEGFYAAATVFVYPSLLEGFGMPILEAMRRRLPVACSNISALPEIAGDAAEFFDPHDDGAIATSIRRLLDDADRRNDLVHRGERRYPQFTWERAAQATLGVYRRALGTRSAARTSDQ